jgi:hypothetical protein
MRKIAYAAWSVEMNKWLVKMRSLFRVVKPGISILLRGHRLFRAARSFCAGSYGPAPVLLPRPTQANAEKDRTLLIRLDTSAKIWMRPPRWRFPPRSWGRFCFGNF